MMIAAAFKRWGLLVLGLALLIVGFALASQPFTFGWFGYADGFARFSTDLVAMPTGAAVALTAGIALIAGWLGFRLGSNSGRKGSDPSP
jgi:membrane protein implicated in regulation of membrane protease activity